MKFQMALHIQKTDATYAVATAQSIASLIHTRGDDGTLGLATSSITASLNTCTEHEWPGSNGSYRWL